MKGKEKLKRIFFGKLKTVPKEIQEGMAAYDIPVPLLNNSTHPAYKVLYALCRLS